MAGLLDYIHAVQKMLGRPGPKVDSAPASLASQIPEKTAMSFTPADLFAHPQSEGRIFTFDGDFEAFISVPANHKALNMVLRGDAVIVPVRNWGRT